MDPKTKFWRFKKPTLEKLSDVLAGAEYVDVSVDEKNQMWLKVMGESGKVLAVMDDSFPCPPLC